MIPTNLLISKITNSDILMTWGNLGIRLIGHIILLPLILKNFSVEEVNLWLLFNSIIFFHSVVDFGFTPTFVRIIAYNSANSKISSNNQDLDFFKKISLSEIIGAMKKIYQNMSLILFFLLISVGTFSMIIPISNLTNQVHGWISWIFVMCSTIITFRGGMYAAYLRGINQIAIQQKWQFYAGFIIIICSIISILINASLLLLVSITTIGYMLSFIFNKKLARRYTPDEGWSNIINYNKEIFNKIWPSVWKSGLGVLFSYLSMQGIGILYAQITISKNSASFLLAQKVIRTITTFTNPIFYNKIPLLAKSYSENKYEKLLNIAKINIFKANWLLAISIIFIGLIIDKLLISINSNTKFVSHEIWILLGIAILLERIGAMHLQIYSVNNDIVWHKANGITGILIFILFPFFYYKYGMIGLPLSFLVSNLFFYMPYCLNKNYKHFKLNFIKFDFSRSFIPIATLIIFYFIKL